jgi:serine/threonine-protein kinase
LNGDRRKLVDVIFTRSLELSGAALEEYLAQHCDDDGVRRDVRWLLEASKVPADRFETPYSGARDRLLADVVAADVAPEEDLTGQRAGNWRIDRRIARGGLATVYLARRDDGEFDQTVALKVLRRGLDTDDVVARFRAERQILSALDHPAIAKILDGGALPDGRPYLVLEYVDGIPITEHCVRARTSIDGRVRLVMRVLQALHHAHKHLVVHRDIKPSNVLVSSEGNVALLDFGIAKLLDPEAVPGASTFTRTGVSLLTPGYGSPEQQACKAVTTASDIYQVGVVLYEMLTGEQPAFARDGDDAGPPSRRLQGTNAHAKVHGDLDAIVQKAMQADPARRYGSASEMLADLERYLDGRPVFAQPDSLGYRLRKLLKRRPWVLPMSALLVLGVIGYVVTLTFHSKQIRREQQRAEAAQEFMVDLFRSPDPYAPADAERGRSITVVEALAIGEKRLADELANQPELRATLLGSLAGVYQSLDQNDKVIDLAGKALALNLELYGEASDEVLDSLRLLGKGYEAVGDHERARHAYDRQLSIARNMYGDGEARLGIAQAASGRFELAQGNHDDGVALLTQGIANLRTEPERYADVMIAAIVAATDQQGLGDHRRHLQMLEEALPLARSVFGPESLHTARVLRAIGANLLELGEYQGAKARYSAGLRIYDAKLGPDHAETAAFYNDYALLLSFLGELAAAEDIFRQVIESYTRLRGADHHLVANSYQNLATMITRQGRVDEALPLHWKAYEVYQASGWDHYRIVYPLLSIAAIEIQRRNAAEAESAATEALQAFRAAVPGSYLEGVALCLVGLAREQQGKVAEGAAMVAASHELIGPDNLIGSRYRPLCRLPGS